MNDFSNDIIASWYAQDIKLNEGVSIQQIDYLEKEVSFQFAEDFKRFYLKVNGFNDFDSLNMFSLFPVDRIKDEYFEQKNQEFIPIGDFMISSHFFGYLKKEPGVFKSYGDGYPVIKICDTFFEFIELIEEDSEILY